MKVFITVFFLFSFCFLGFLQAQQDPWQLRENKDGIPVYTRKVADSPILEYKSSVTIDAPIHKVIAFFEDEKQISRWYYQCVHSELIETDGPKQKVVYLILHLPWPVTARDIVFQITKFEDLAQGTTNYTIKALPDRLPRAKGMIRVPAIKTLWIFKSISEDRTEVFFQQYSDPGGSIPAFLVNGIAVDTPYFSLKKFRELVTQKSI